MIKILAFDIDGTLAESKQKIGRPMAEMLGELLTKYKIALVSGGSLEQFQKQIISHIDIPYWGEIIAFPTSGAECYIMDSHNMVRCYSHILSNEEVTLIENSLEKAFKLSGFKKYPTPYGPCLENRGAQLTYSCCGQKAPLSVKASFDPDGSKRKKVLESLEKLLPGYSCRMGGTTSIDITRAGINKAYAMRQLMSIARVTKDEILFYGDALYEGGNDRPVLDMGVACIEVTSPEDCLDNLRRLPDLL